MRVLVIGAREHSIGWYVDHIATSQGYEVTTAGVSGEERIHLDLLNDAKVHDQVRDLKPDHVVCTAGVNLEGTIQGKGWLKAMQYSTRVNYFGPMILLSAWARLWRDEAPKGITPIRHFTAVTSNSAFIPRSKSGSYCASKAALEMAMRCAAREEAGEQCAIYTYAPGWVAGTPMSKQVEERLQGQDGHRIPGGEPIRVEALANMVVRNLMHGKELNGTCIRVDGGEI